MQKEIMKMEAKSITSNLEIWYFLEFLFQKTVFTFILKYIGVRT